MRFGDQNPARGFVNLCTCTGIRYTDVDTSFTSSKVASIGSSIV